MFLLAAAIVLATLLVFKGVKIFNYLDHMAGIMEMIPGPTPYPFVGNLFQFGLKPAGKLDLPIFMNYFRRLILQEIIKLYIIWDYTGQIRIAM